MKKKFKFSSQKIIIWVVAALVLAGVLWAAQASGFFGSRVIGPLDMRPWRRVTQAKPVGVRVEPVVFRPVSEPSSFQPTVPSSHARLAIILDDWGMSEELMDDAIALKRPITLAILPHLAHSADIAHAAAAHGLGVILHMPMQAKSRSVAKEPEIISVGMPDVRIRRYLDEALASIPGVQGMNNHQGSAATSDARVMRTVLSYLKTKNLFFVDSFVIASTTGPAVAKEIDIPFTRRDVFIDNDVQIESIKNQLRKAIKKAKQNKTAVAIGHDKRPTLQAISQMIPEIEKAGVKLVLVEELTR